MIRDAILTDELLKFCGEIKVDRKLVGFADPKYFKDRYPEQFRPETYLTDVQTVVIIGFHLFDIGLDAWCLGNEENGSYQFVDQILVFICSRIRKFLMNKGYKSKTISYKAGLYLKETAALAGIGFIGRNNLLINENYGPQVRFRALVTDAPLICGTLVNESEYCNSCNLCIDACPANAFPDGIYNKDLCNNYGYSNLKMVSKQTSIFCNACIEACIVGKKRENES